MCIRKYIYIINVYERKYIIEISTYSHLNTNIYIKIYVKCLTVQMLPNCTVGKIVTKACLKSFVFSK